jgi:hypothetical protein
MFLLKGEVKWTIQIFMVASENATLFSRATILCEMFLEGDVIVKLTSYLPIR